MRSKNLADQNHWDKAYEALDFFKPGRFDPIGRIIRTYIPKATGDRSAFEVGCFPGRYLSVLGDLGYRLNGIDLTPRVEGELPAWLSKNGYAVGTFYRDDFLSHANNFGYDAVCSFGFIEHFTNYREIIEKHVHYVSPGGYLIITTPNFAGSVQRALHASFDKENMERHHLPAMDPFEWKAVLEAQGFSILFCGWKGGFDFWAESKGNTVFGKIIVRILNLSGKLLRFLPFSHRSFSPYAVVVARRQSDGAARS